jgi:hypothetical protein
MFLLDSLMISGIRWALETTLTAAEAEMNDDTVLREELLAAEMRREMGEISDEAFRALEADLLARIRAIKERRDGGSGPLAFGATDAAAGGEESRFAIEASVSGDFHEPPAAALTTHVIDVEPVHHAALGHLVDAHGVEQIAVIDQDPPARAPRPRRPRATRPAVRNKAARRRTARRA